MRIFTLGAHNLSEADFAKTLSKYQIQVVADIRRTAPPGNLKRDDIQKACRENKVEYLYLGNELGSNRETGSKRDMDPAFFDRGISILKSLARTRGLLILCAEYTPERCNRRVIAEELRKDGAEVLHLLNLMDTWTPSQSGARRSGGGGRAHRSARSDRNRRRQAPMRRDRGDRRSSSRSPKQNRKEPPLKKKTGRSKMDKVL